MQTLTSQLSMFDSGAAVLFIIVGLVYGLLGWRVVRALVMLDALALAAVCVYWTSKIEVFPQTAIPALPAGILIAAALPVLAWFMPEKAKIAMAGFAGFVSVQLLIMGFDLPLVAVLVLGIVGAALVMAMALSTGRQATVIVTGMHGGWLCVAALAILAANNGNVIGPMLKSFAASFSLITPIAVIVFSAILIFLQWSDMQGHTSESE
ncbi:MAG TPA: hypothetical protein VNT79_12110 [Phycisphaerae bacterium]|nr:hypothetical protein [Phycisphaerae bacterium]